MCLAVSPLCYARTPTPYRCCFTDGAVFGQPKSTLLLHLSAAALHHDADRTPGALRDWQCGHQHALVQELHRAAAADLPHGNARTHTLKWNIWLDNGTSPIPFKKNKNKSL